MENLIQPKNSFKFTAKFFDGSERELEVEIATPYNTQSFNGIKGIELNAEFSDFVSKIQNYQLTLTSEFAKQDEDFALYLSIPEADFEKNTYSAYFTDLEWYKIQRLNLQTKEIPNKVAIEIYKYIVETIFSSFTYDMNTVSENGEKGWYSIENSKEIVYEYIKVYSEKYGDFLTLSPNQIQNIFQELVKGMMSNKIQSGIETLSTELSQLS